MPGAAAVCAEAVLSAGGVVVRGSAVGAVVGTVFCHLLVGRAIWLTMIPLGIIFLTLLHADRTTEKELVEQKPAGH